MRVVRNSISLMQRIRVPLGFLFAAVFAVFARPTVDSLWTGLLLALLGLLVRLWSTGYLRKQKELCVSGPYRRTRNPLYFGSFLMGVGFSVAGGTFWLLLLFLVLFLAIYIPVMRREELELVQEYGSAYEQYRKAVPVFLPSFRPFRGTPSRNFSAHQIILNREYNAVLGFLIASAFLLVKLKWW